MGDMGDTGRQGTRDRERRRSGESSTPPQTDMVCHCWGLLRRRLCLAELRRLVPVWNTAAGLVASGLSGCRSEMARLAASSEVLRISSDISLSSELSSSSAEPPNVLTKSSGVIWDLGLRLGLLGPVLGAVSELFLGELALGGDLALELELGATRGVSPLGDLLVELGASFLELGDLLSELGGLFSELGAWLSELGDLFSELGFGVLAELELGVLPE